MKRNARSLSDFHEVFIASAIAVAFGLFAMFILSELGALPERPDFGAEQPERNEFGQRR